MCAIVGVQVLEAAGISFTAAELAFEALEPLQHRGQQSVGISASDGTDIRVEKQMGLVRDFNRSALKRLPGSMAIGHLRYSTSGKTRQEEAQPLWLDTWHGQIAVAHNGNILDQ